MKPLIAFNLLVLSTIFLSCSKGSSKQETQSVTVETGIYVGRLDNFKTNQTINQFRIELTQTGTNMYKIRQIDNGNIPEISMEDKAHTYPFASFRIPVQSFQGFQFSGNGSVSGGFDALFNTQPKSIFFSITYDSDPNKPIQFNGNKQ